MVISKVLNCINVNAYKIEFSRDYEVFATFNVADVSSYYEDQEDLDSKACFLQLEYDARVLRAHDGHTGHKS